MFSAELFVEAEVLNAFNEQSQIRRPRGRPVLSRNTDASLLGCKNATTGAAMRCLQFNPFTTVPVEGTHYFYAPTFGPSDRFRRAVPARAYVPVLVRLPVLSFKQHPAVNAPAESPGHFF